MTKHPVLVALTVVALAVVALLFDWHLYLFDRPEYLIRRAAEKCVAAEMAVADYNECRTVGYRDKRCEYFRALYVERHGECAAAHAAVDAEGYRRRAR